MKPYYITSIGYNVLGDELDQTLCEYQGKIEFRQPSFERAWTVLDFSTQFEALKYLRELYPERLLTLFEDSGKVLTHVNDGQESWLTAIVIKKEKDYGNN